MNLRTTLFAAAAVVAFAGTASAMPVGSLTLSANVITQPTTVTVDQATGLNFVGVSGADNGSAAGTVLNFLGSNITAGTGGTINDISNFASYSTGVLFTLSDGVTFTLNAPLTITRNAATSTALASLAVGGSGTFSGGGFDTTSGVFTITTQGTQATVNMSSGSGTSTAVPEPASIALLGGSLAAIGMIRRRRSK